MAGEYSDEQKDFADRITKGFNGGKPQTPKDEDKPNAMKRRMLALSAPKEE